MNNPQNYVFYDENDNVITHKILEIEKQLDLSTYLPYDSIVLELSAQYGMFSC
jgi:hypothetical protein